MQHTINDQAETASAVEGILSRAHVLMSAGNRADAANLFDSALEIAPHHPAALFGRAQIHLLTGDGAAAEALLRRGRSLVPTDPGMAYLHGISLLVTGAAAEAVDVLKQAVALAPDDAGAALMLVRALRANGDHNGLVRLRAGILDCFPDDVRVLTELGSDLLEEGDAPAAAELFERALALSPEHPDILHNLGVACARSGLLAKAEELLRRALIRRPDHPPSQAVLAGVLQQAARLDEAMALARALIERGVELPAALTALGTALAALKRPAEAVEAFSGTERLDPGNLTARINLAEALEACARIDEAMMRWRFAVEHPASPGFPEAAAKLRLYGAAPTEGEAIRRLFRLTDLPAGRPAPLGADAIDIAGAALCLDQWHLVREDALAYDLVFTQPLGGERFVVTPGVTGTVLVRDDLPRTRIERPTLFLGGTRNYYHWLIDFLPRWAALESLEDRADWPILINSDPTSFQRRTLELLGIDPARLMVPDGLSLATFDHLAVPRLPSRRFRPNGIPEWMASTLTPEIARWLRDRLAAGIAADPDSPRRIMISREGSDFRRCDNEASLRAIARRHGFEPVRLEELPFDRQVALFKGAEAVLAVHGAGCTNMLFAPAGATLIELHPFGHLPEFYARLTAVLGQRHRAIPGPITQSLAPAAPSFWNFRADPADVDLCLAEL